MKRKNLSIDVSAFNENDPLHFRLVFEKYHKGLLAFARDITSDDDLANIVISDVFMAAWHMQNKHFVNEANLFVFLRTTTKNKSIDYLRKKPRDGKMMEISEIENLMSDDIDTHDISASVLEMLNEHIEDLPKKCRQVIRLLYFQNKSEEEVAVIMGISRHTVRNQRERAINKLRKKMTIDKRRFLIMLVLLWRTLNN